MDNVKKIAITTDTNSGMIPNTTNELGIFVLPMPFVVDGQDFYESVDLSREDYFTKLVGGSKISTSQPSVGDVTDFWTNILKDYDEIIHIPTSSLLSASFSTAKALSEEQEFAGKVFMVDNRRISAALKSSVYDAAKLRDQGKSSAEIVKALEEMSADYAIYFSLETMEYLKRGGRISPAAAAIGGILKLRPVLHLEGGPLEKFALPRTLVKAKDCMKQAIAKDLGGRFKQYYENGEVAFYFIYGEKEENIEEFKAEMTKLYPNIPVLGSEPLSFSVACHTGPGVVSIGLIRVVK